jgi:putative intracellular protease/amidase
MIQGDTVKRNLLFIAIFAFLTTLHSGAEPTRVLMVLTSHDKLGDTGKSTGFYLTEVTHPFEVFRAAGFEVEMASPQGNHPPIDGMDSADEESKELLFNPNFRRKLATTIPLAKVDFSRYDAIFFAGGHGTMWDLPDNEDVKRLTSGVYENGGIVGAVCHGPAALVNVRLSDGSYLVAGQPLAAFTNEEEEAAGLTDVMPFLLEDKLRNRGADIQEAPNFKKKVVVGRRLVTGQNPASAAGVAEEMVKLLK